MTHHLPPDAWRSEAFADDLCEDAAAFGLPQPSWWLRAATNPLLSLLPMVALATAGMAAAVWVGA